MTRVQIYMEGGGPEGKGDSKDRDSQPALGRRRHYGYGKEIFRKSVMQLFVSALGENAGNIEIVPCGGIEETVWLFLAKARAVLNADAVLVVDSDNEVTEEPLMHLVADERFVGNEKCAELANADPDMVHLMVQCMESWLIADPAGLSRAYGGGFEESALPITDDPESVPKSELGEALYEATKNTALRKYRKISHLPAIFGAIDGRVVRERCKHFDMLCSVLEELICAKSGVQSELARPSSQMDSENTS